MTDEQIKQNAKNFAINETDGLAIKYFPCEKGYIAGAHSRDEEIRELNGQVTLHKERADYYHDLYMKLRTPWISVDEGLPEKLENDCVSDYVLTKIDGPRQVLYLVNKYNYAIKSWEGCNNSTTHWMPIPTSKKGN